MVAALNCSHCMWQGTTFCRAVLKSNASFYKLIWWRSTESPSPLEKYFTPSFGIAKLALVSNAATQGHRSTTPKFVTSTALSCIDNSWRSTTLSPPKKLTSSIANLEWCHVHFIRDSYSTFIHQVIGLSKNSMESFFNAKFHFKSRWNRDSTTSHHKHPVCQYPAGEAEKLTNVWSR